MSYIRVYMSYIRVYMSYIRVYMSYIRVCVRLAAAHTPAHCCPSGRLDSAHRAAHGQNPVRLTARPLLPIGRPVRLTAVHYV